MVTRGWENRGESKGEGVWPVGTMSRIDREECLLVFYDIIGWT
jgi:hypothetical protein